MNPAFLGYPRVCVPIPLVAVWCVIIPAQAGGFLVIAVPVVV